MEGVLRFPNVLLVALPALDEVDDIPRLAGCRSVGVVADPSGSTLDCCPSLYVVTGQTPSVATGVGSMCLLR